MREIKILKSNKNYVFAGDHEHDNENSQEKQRGDCFLKHRILPGHSHYLFDLSRLSIETTQIYVVGIALLSNGDQTTSREARPKREKK